MKPKIWKSVFTAILSAGIFIAAAILASLLVGTIAAALTGIPLIGSVIRWAFFLDNGSPWLAYIIGGGAAFMLTVFLCCKICREDSDASLAMIIAGVLILLLFGMSLIYQIISKDLNFFSIVGLISGIRMISWGRRLAM